MSRPDPIEHTDGRWILRGGIKVWQGPRPGRSCIDCDTTIPDAAHGLIVRCPRCTDKDRARRKEQRKQAAKKARKEAIAAALAATPPSRICDCGCLIQVGEDCPVCVRLWCRQVENEWNRRAA